MVEHTITSNFRVADNASRPMRNIVNAAGDYRDALGRLRNAQGRFINDTNSSNTASTSLNKTIGKLFKGFTALFIIKKVSSAVAASIMEFGDFEEQMLKVKAVSNATGTQFDALSKQAREIGKNSKLSAREVASLQFELAKLGFAPEQIMEMTDSIGQLSVALGTDLAQSAEVAGKTLRQFSLDADEMERVTNVIAEASSNSALDLSSFAEAMKFAGTTAGGLGISLEEASAAIGSLSNVGLQGTLAGTGLSRVMLDLADNTSKASKLLKGYTGDANDLSAKFQFLKAQGLTVTEVFDAFGKIAGKSALALIDNADAMAELEEEFKNGDKQLGRMTDTMSQGVNYELDIMKSAFSELKILIGEAFSEDTISLIKGTTNALVGLSDVLKIARGEELASSWETNKTTLMGLMTMLEDLEKIQETGGKRNKKRAKEQVDLIAKLVGGNETYIKSLDRYAVVLDNGVILREQAIQQMYEELEVNKQLAQEEKKRADDQKKRQEEMKKLSESKSPEADPKEALKAQKVRAEAIKKEREYNRNVYGQMLNDRIEKSNKEMEWERFRNEQLSIEAEQQLEWERNISQQRIEIARLEREELERQDAMRAENKKAFLTAGFSLFNTFSNYQIEQIKKESKTEEEARKKAKKHFMAQRAMALVQTGINTAEGVSNALTIKPAALATPTALAVGALGLAQVAKIASSPLPQLATGAVIAPRAGGVPAIMAENGAPELAINAGASGRPLLNTFSDMVGDRISQYSNNIASGAVNIHIGSVDSSDRAYEVYELFKQGVNQGLYSPADFERVGG